MIPLTLICLAIGSNSDHITAADLGFEGVARSTQVALAPVAGSRRVFRVAELRRLASRLHAANAPEKDLCFERPAAPLSATRLLAAMQRQAPGAHIEVLDFSRFHVPEGELEFPISGLRQTAAGGFWSGSVRYAGSRRFLIWAKVRVRISAQRVVAAEPLKSGQPLKSSQLRLEIRDDFPAAAPVISIEEVEGKILRRAVPAGVAIQKEWLEAPRDVARGDAVRVAVHSGGAVLAFEGLAESGGFTGQSIAVLNPASKKRFQARIDGKGKVSIGKGSL